MKSLRQNKNWSTTHPDLTIINAHGIDYNGPFEYQLVQAGGRVIEDNTAYHKYNRYLMIGGLEAMKQADWYDWAFVSHYPNGRPTPELIVYEYEKFKAKQ